ncbi:MAG: diguanylate cyclase [Thermodesulfobacteriota bacterium]|nr:diguanylate cyclase [Thermodesulfobacteriota bacterium]
MAVKILIVDDDPFVLDTISYFITSFGHECESAGSGLEALEKLRGEPYRIVISDIDMPGMSGMELLKEIKKDYPDIGVIIVTGYADNFSYANVIRDGAIDFISKPFQQDELEAKLNRVIREQDLIKELERLSNCDPLTGLYNRRFFDLKLTEELRRAARQDYLVVLAMLDIDRFKSYNDTFGHQGGDELLQQIAHVFRVCTRENVDFVFRYGGDEFAIILTQTSIEQSKEIARRILDTYQDQELDIGETGLSIGLVESAWDEKLSWPDNVSVLVERADLALYQAKNEGRNRICVWGEQLSSE